MTTQNSSLRDKFLNVENTLNSLFIERQEMIKYIMASLAIDGNMIMVGKRGSAKTKIVQTLAELIHVDRTDIRKFFEVGINAYTIPDEVYGPMDIGALKQGKYVRVDENFGPNSLINFFDEIFKGKDQTLNTMLKYILEKKYSVNGLEKNAVVRWFFGASNEFGDKSKLGPFEDRFNCWLPAFYIEDDDNFMKLLEMNVDGFPSYQKGIIDIAEIDAIQAEVKAVRVSKETIVALKDVRKKFFGNNNEVSDRTFCRILALLKYSAWYDGRTETTSDDLEIMWVSCWDHTADMKGEIAKTKQIIQSVIGQEREDLIAIQDKVEGMIKTAATDTDLKGTVRMLNSIKKDLTERKIKKTNEKTREEVLRTINNVIVLLSGMAQRQK